MKYLLTALLFCFSALCSETLEIKCSEKHDDFELAQWGRGIAINKNTVITANHVVDANDRVIEVQVQGKWVLATVIAKDETCDLALLHVEAKLDPVEVLDVPKLITVGSPGVNPAVARLTEIEGMKTRVDGMTKLEDPRDIGGLSGSPVLADGRLIGIVSAAGHDSGGCYVICIGPEPIRKLIDSLKK